MLANRLADLSTRIALCAASHDDAQLDAALLYAEWAFEDAAEAREVLTTLLRHRPARGR